MKKENEKLQKVNAEATQNVGGGMLVRSNASTPDNVLYDVIDNKTKEVVASELPMYDALKINKLYNRRDEIQKVTENHSKNAKKSDSNFNPLNYVK